VTVDFGNYFLVYRRATLFWTALVL